MIRAVRVSVQIIPYIWAFLSLELGNFFTVRYGEESRLCLLLTPLSISPQVSTLHCLGEHTCVNGTHLCSADTLRKQGSVKALKERRANMLATSPSHQCLKVLQDSFGGKKESCDCWNVVVTMKKAILIPGNHAKRLRCCA